MNIKKLGPFEFIVKYICITYGFAILFAAFIIIALFDILLSPVVFMFRTIYKTDDKYFHLVSKM